MSRKEEILRRAEELARQEREAGRERKASEPYTRRRMNSEKMPLGCWVVIGIVILIILGLTGVFKIFH